MSTAPKEVAATLDAYAEASLTGDRDGLNALLDAEYEFVSARAQVMNRERRLQTLADSRGVLASLVFEEPAVRIVGDVAIATAGFIAEFRPSTGRSEPDRGVATLVFVRRSDGWRLWHQHNSHFV